MKELKVGERITITLEAVEHEDCNGCFFKDGGCYNFKCDYAERSDNKRVIFKEVKKENV